jgi:two-component system, sensor histidine kinase and response regulator
MSNWCFFCLLALWLLFGGQSEAYAQRNQAKIDSYLQRANQQKAAGDLRGASDFLNQVALIYWEERDQKTAISYFMESLELNRGLDNASGISGIYSNLAMLYSDLNKYDSALAYFEKNLVGRRKLGRTETIISSLINLSVVLNNLGRYNESAGRLLEALELAKERKDLRQMQSCYGMLAETYQKAGDNERMSQYFELYRTFHELVQKSEMGVVKQEAEAERLKAMQLMFEKEKAELRAMISANALAEKNKEVSATNSALDSVEALFTKQELGLKVLQQDSELKKARFEKQLEIDRRQISLRDNLIIIAVLVVVFTLTLLYLFYRNNIKAKAVNLVLQERNAEISAQKVEIDAQVKELGELNQFKNRLFTIISHDLLSPIATIKTIFGMLNNQRFSKEEFEELLPGLTDSVNVSFGLLENLLVWAKGQMKGEQQRKSVVDLHEICENKKVLFNKAISEKGIVFQQFVEPSTLVYADKDMLDLVLRNLVANAVKFTLPQGRISVGATRKGTLLEVQVTDTGVGINPKNLERLAQQKSFTTAGTANEKGSGLGLLLCKDFVVKNGGEMWVTSEPGKGSSFFFTVPLEQA